VTYILGLNAYHADGSAVLSRIDRVEVREDFQERFASSVVVSAYENLLLRMVYNH